MKVNLNFSGLDPTVFAAYQDRISQAHLKLHERSGEGSEYLGWVDYVTQLSPDLIADIKQTAHMIREEADVLVVIGIGGSYLGAKAVIEALTPSFDRKPEILFAGNAMSSLDLSELVEYIRDKNVFLNVISKSGTTLEPAVAFRVLRQLVEQKYGEEANRRIIATTDENKGALLELAMEKGYKRYIVPDDIGGRYSVMTPVGLLPIAASGVDLDAFLQGFRGAEQEYAEECIETNQAYRYALARNLLLDQGKSIEIFTQYKPRLSYLSEWLKQLYGESEGKDHKGIFPASVINSTDLHSLGQYIQDGQRFLFETVIDFRSPSADIFIPQDAANLDGLNYLSGKDLHFINRKAMMATILAHVEGGVPNILLETERYDAKTIGKLMYFFMKACGLSGYLLGVNPFNQPGVEEYKLNMFALLGKPGSEERKAELEDKLNQSQAL